MPDLLLCSTDNAAAQQLEHQARALGYRVKVASNEKLATGWAKSQPFDLALLDAALPLESVMKIGPELWQMNPTTPIIVISIAGIAPSYDRMELTLAGIDYIEGIDVANRLQRALQRTADKKRTAGENFDVLVVEDLDSPRDIICAFVEHIGYPSVKGVGSANGALHQLESDPGKFQCILTDINMPGVNGKQLIELIRKHNKLQHIPIVVLTAYGTADNLIECLEAGASGFLVKPPTKASLHRELGRAMRIVQNHENPRLVKPGDTEHLRKVLASKGFQ